MSDAQKGVLAIVGASSIWGLSALYYRFLLHVPPLEILAHRTVWSMVFFALVLAFQGRLTELLHVYSNRKRLMLILVSGTMISINWFMFIFSIQIGRAVESSFGYYIFPLIAVLFGVVLLGEKMTRAKWVAVALASFAVLMLSFGLGGLPLISLLLAVTFGIYGLIKSQLDIGPVLSISAEVLLLTPLALIWLGGVHWAGWTGLNGVNLGAFGNSWQESLGLIMAGPVTAVPLLLFSYASRRVSLSTVGLVQYLNPTLQAMVAVLVLGESFSRWHAIAFPLIWLGLGIYSFEAIRLDRAARKAARVSGTVSMTETKSSTEVSAKP